MKIQGTKIRGLKLYSSAATVDADSYFDLVTLLLPGNGTNGAQNNTFQDSSVNAYTITRNGNTTQGTFSPFSQTGWSGYFDGTGDYLTAPSNSAFAFGTGDFSIEAWVYPQGTQNYNTIAATNSSGSYQTGRWWFEYSQTRGFAFVTGSVSYVQACTVNLNVWTHIAVTRSGTSLRFFLNGVQQGSTQTASDDLNTTTTCAVGALANGVQPFTGYISNARIVKGSAVYTANFTVPTTPLTAISGTSLLTCQSNRFIDNSTNAFAITVNGNTAVQAFAPFNPTTAYAAGTVGGSGYFDGTGDSLSIAGSAALGTTGDLTLEAWVYVNSVPNYAGIFSMRNSVNSDGLAINILNTGYLDFSIDGSSAGEYTGTLAPLQQWCHVALVRSGSSTNNVSCYLNGNRVGQFTSNFNTNGASNAAIVGRYYATGADQYNLNGYIGSLRYVVGTALYAGTTLTVPTAPFTAIANTAILLNFTNGGITDATAKNVLETVGGAAISTTQSKWGGSSMYFDGSGDYLSMVETAILNFGSSDFTIEAWIYATATVGANRPIWSTGTNSTNWMSLYLHTTAGRPEFAIISGGSTIIDLFPSDVVSTNTWYHLAVTRSGSTFRMFLNGTVISSGTSATAVPDYTDNYRVGYGRWNGDTGVYAGYINDLRITRGYARYTANFTPPTTAFPTQ